MKAYEAITEANSLSPNQYDNALKLRWLADLDGRIRREIMREAPRDRGADAGNKTAQADSAGQNSEAENTSDYVADGLYISDNEAFGSGGSGTPSASADGVFDMTDVVLLVPEPWARDVYVNYLLSRVAQSDAETERYNLYATLFNSAYGEFAAWYNRTTHKRRGRSWRY